MDDLDYHKERSYRFLAAVFLLILLGASVWLRQSYPFATKWLSIVMTIAGVPIFIWTAVVVGRYSKVYDYEQTTFMGRQMNGRRVRNLVYAAGLTGIGLSLIGATLYVFGMM